MLKIYVDAATNGQTGQSAGGIIILNGRESEQIHLSLDACTNHEAEFNVFLSALEVILARQQEKQTIAIHSDSKIVIETFEKQYTKNRKFKKYLNEFQKLETNFSLLLMKWIPEKQNKGADSLAKQALLKQVKNS